MEMGICLIFVKYQLNVVRREGTVLGPLQGADFHPSRLTWCAVWQQVPLMAAVAHHQDLEPGCPSEPGGLLNVPAVMVGPRTVMVAL